MNGQARPPDAIAPEDAPRRRVSGLVIALLIVIVALVAVLAIVLTRKGEAPPQRGELARDATIGATTTASDPLPKSNLPTEQDLINACHQVIESRLYANLSVDVLWETAKVAADMIYTVTGTGRADPDGLSMPLTFMCTVLIGPPVEVIDNSYSLS